ncbi:MULTISPECIES: hypothetical protein [unclassified Anabaena]|uniref:hypothetical protein n=1 Tax=unclassified Anabaena TaxID=2619674 RepID=UPI0039C68F9C
MSKLILATLFTTALLLTSANHPSVTLAGTCAAQCGPRPMQFTPGQRVRVQVVNRTPRVIQLQKLAATDPIALQPGQELTLEHGHGTTPNLSLIFWDDTGLSVQANVSKPNFGTLQVEFRPTWSFPGDRSIYILNDGRVDVL